MAESKPSVRSLSSEQSESSQHDMMSLVNMATGTEPTKAPTANEIGDQLRTQQWEQYLSEQLVKNRASNKIAFLASNVKAAMEDRSTKDRKALSDKITAFFTKNMCRVPGATTDQATVTTVRFEFWILNFSIQSTVCDALSNEPTPMSQTVIL